MKKLELKKLQEKDIKDLQNQVLELKKKLATVTADMYSKGEGNLKQGKLIKRDIAQVLTLIAQKGKEKSK